MLEVFYISAQSQGMTISNILPFVVEAVSILLAYSYSTFIACVTSCLVICFHRERCSTRVSSVYHTKVGSEKVSMHVNFDMTLNMLPFSNEIVI